MMADGTAINKWFKIRQDQLNERQRDILEGRIDLGDADGEIAMMVMMMVTAR